MRKYDKETFIKVIRHLATYFDVYNIVGKRSMAPEDIKWRLMKHANKPESTARYYINKIKEEPGLFVYDPSDDLITISSEAVVDFLYNIEILLRFSEKRHEGDIRESVGQKQDGEEHGHDK